MKVETGKMKLANWNSQMKRTYETKNRTNEWKKKELVPSKLKLKLAN